MGQERLAFVSAGRHLQGTLRIPDAAAPVPCVVLCHGFGSYDDDLGGFDRLADFFAEAGLATFRFSFSGSHPCPDVGTIRPASQWVDDALSALGRMGRHPSIDPGRLGLLGVSVGGGVAIQAAALCRQARAVVALAPVSDGQDWLRYRWRATHDQAAWEGFVAEVEADHRECVMGRASRSLPQRIVQSLPDTAGWEALLRRFPRILPEVSLASVWDTFHFKPLFYARAIVQPLCLVHGDADESVPLKHSQDVLAEACGQKVLHVLKGSPHCPWETPHESRFQQISLEWFQKWLA